SSVTIKVRPSGTYWLTGVVKETPELLIAGAAIEMLDGASAGVSVTTNSFGSFQILAAAGEQHVRVSKPGYESIVRLFSFTDDQRFDLYLTPTEAYDRIAGEYHLSITASDTCAKDDIPLSAAV